MVEQVLREETGARAVFDPFSGTATTTLAAACQGVPAFSVDINPFLVWFGSLKTKHFSRRELEGARSDLEHCLGVLAEIEPVPAPALHNIQRWWPVRRLEFLRRLMAAIQCCADGAGRDLLTVAFCRTMIGLSNAAFNHQSLSFKLPAARRDREQALILGFRADAEYVLASAAVNPSATARVARDDSRLLTTVARASFDLLITSPPYPNRMSYIRELRPYMYWTGHLREAREAGELDWLAIGGTWGVATSRLTDWAPPSGQRLPKLLAGAVRAIERSAAANAALLGSYVAKYFHDLDGHVRAVSERIATGGRVHYIVGNSTFYGVLVPTERGLAQMLRDHGFRDVAVRVLRKRNSKKELFEYDVVACKA